ncbi:MAG: hypothetical protein ABIR70_20170 [Bryobacteraceae bacterium]
MSSRVRLFVVICVVSGAALAWILWRNAPAAAIPASAPATVAEPATPPPTSQTVSLPAAPVAPPTHKIFFRSTNPTQHYGELAFVEYPGLLKPQYQAQWNCEVAYFAGGKGSCLTADRGVFTTYAADIFDAGFKKLFSIPLSGIPSRTRVSPNGRLAAVTVFVTGHGYDSVDFTTQTSLIDTTTGKIVADMESFTVSKDGQPFTAKDFNFWGVTFASDNDRFYSTLSSNRQHYLIQGSVKARTARVIHENVECPSLSPDGTRIGYKKRLPGDRVIWQIQVLDLRTMAETALAERRSVDDQLEWLDDAQLLYSLPHGDQPGPSTDVWVASADGRVPPKVFLANAYSPSVGR